MRKDQLRIATILVVCLTLPLATAEQVSLTAPEPNYVVEPHSTVEGKPIIEWTDQWWEWIATAPRKNNPAKDKTGQNCSINQPKTEPMWFLAGLLTSGTANRTCKVPAGKHILFPILNARTQYRKGLFFCKGAKKVASNFMDSPAKMWVNLDGKYILNPSKHRESSGDCEKVSSHKTQLFYNDGYWIMLRPLAKGVHQLHFGGLTKSKGFGLDIKYTLIVD